MANIVLIDAAIYIPLYEEMEGGTIPILLYNEQIRANWPVFNSLGMGNRIVFVTDLFVSNDLANVL